MIKVLRKHRNWLMIVIAILALPFCIYFVKSDPGAIRSDEFARMYGRKISLIEARRDAGLFQLADFLQLSDLTGALAPGHGEFNQRAPSFIINLTVLRHEAEQLGIEPAESELIDEIKKFPGLQGQSGFDPAKYDQVERNVLPSLGFTDEQLRELARDQISLKRIKQIVGSAVTLPESEAKSSYEQLYGKNFVTVVRVKASDLAKDIKVSDDEIKKYYETHKSELKTEPKRKVEFVRLALNDEQKKLKDKARVDALQKLADSANNVSQALVDGGDFHQTAAKYQLPIETTGEFTSSEPDPKLKADSQLNQAAFKLTQQDPTSDPVQSADGFAIMHLVSFVEARQLTLDEAKPKVVDAIKADRSREIATTKGRQAADSLKNALKSGKPLPVALKEAGGLKADKLEPFMLADDMDKKNPQEKPTNEAADTVIVKNMASALHPGEVSDFAPWIDGGVIVILDKRESPDPAKYQETKTKMEERYLKTAREYVFEEWLRDRQRNADLVFARG